MENKLKILGSSILLSISAILLWEQPEGKAVFLVVATFFSLLYCLFRDSKGRSIHPDKALFKSFLKELPYHRSICFLTEHNFCAPFGIEALNDLGPFLSIWQDAEHEFSNKKLEKTKKELIARIEEFQHKMIIGVFPIQGRYVGVNYDTNSTNREETGKELNHLAHQIVESHQELVRLGRKNIPDIDISRQEQKDDD
jgi:hypothetical protein